MPFKIERKNLLTLYICKRHPRTDLLPYSKVACALQNKPPASSIHCDSLHLLCFNGNQCMHCVTSRNLKQDVFPVSFSSQRPIFIIKENTACECARNASFSCLTSLSATKKTHILSTKKLNPYCFMSSSNVFWMIWLFPTLSYYLPQVFKIRKTESSPLLAIKVTGLP